MGKADKKKRSRQSRVSANPLAAPNGSMTRANGEGKDGKEENVLPVLKKLAAPDAIEREWAAVAVSHLVTEDAGTRRLLQGKNIVGLLIERLSDSVDDVVVEAMGALRNLAIEGGYNLCAEMYNKAILSPIRTLIPRISESLTAILADSKPSLQGRMSNSNLVWTLADNLLSVIWNLAETSEKILRGLNGLDLFPWISAFILNLDQVPMHVVVTAAHALYVLTDDNPDATKSLQQQDLSNLRSVLNRKTNDSSVALIKALVGGSLMNIEPSTELISNLAPTLTDVLLSVDLVVLTQEATQALKAAEDQIIAQEAKLKEHNLKKSAMDEKPDVLSTVQRKATLLQLSLELLTNMCIQGLGDDTGDGWVDEAPVDDLEGMEEDMAELTEADTNGNDPNGIDTPMVMQEDPNLPVSFAFLIPRVFPKLLTLLTSQSQSFPPPPSTVSAVPTALDESLCNMLVTTHLRALDLLNNFLVAASSSTEGKEWLEQQNTSIDFESDDFASQHNLVAMIWEKLSTLLDTVSGTSQAWATRNENIAKADTNDEAELRRREVVESILACMWALARGLADGAQVNVGIRAADYEKTSRGIHQLYISSASSSSCKVKCVGLLGCLARRRNGIQQSAIKVNATIGTFLMDEITSQEDVDIIIEALNAIYDVYGDISYEYDGPVFRARGFLNRLQGLRGRIRTATKGIDRRKMPDLRMRADEALENLVAFIRYKEKEARS